MPYPTSVLAYELRILRGIRVCLEQTVHNGIDEKK